MMKITVHSIPMSEEEAKRWPSSTDRCSKCGEQFGTRKIGRDEGGRFYHYNGCPLTERQVTETKHHTFVAEASSLGWPVGHWPGRIRTTLGNGMDFFRTELTEAGAEYRQHCGCIKLVVLND